ncbi:hypothetical protein THAOC_28302, partial [Thalassiosira oceanica]
MSSGRSAPESTMANIRIELESMSTTRIRKRRASTRSTAKFLAFVAATALLFPSEAFVNNPSQRCRTHQQSSRETVLRRLLEDNTQDTSNKAAKGSEVTSTNGAKRVSRKKKAKKTSKIRKTPIQISTKSLTPYPKEILQLR